jgi:hypothetical protein
MTPKQAKLAYFLFFSCFTIWIALILSVGFLSDGETTPIIFSNNFMLTIFLGSAVLSSIPAMFIGLDFLGIDFRLRQGKQNFRNTLPLIRIRKNEPRLKTTSAKDSVRKSETSEDSPLTEQTDETKNASAELACNAKGNNKSKDSKKAFFLFGETEFNGCSFKLGHLKSLPKNKPIPDECFGCPQILECIALSGK